MIIYVSFKILIKTCIEIQRKPLKEPHISCDSLSHSLALFVTSILQVCHGKLGQADPDAGTWKENTGDLCGE